MTEEKKIRLFNLLSQGKTMDELQELTELLIEERTEKVIEILSKLLEIAEDRNFNNHAWFNLVFLKIKELGKK